MDLCRMTLWSRPAKQSLDVFSQDRMRFCGAVAIALGMGFMGGLVIEIPDYSE
jgi:hypothetical protein